MVRARSVTKSPQAQSREGGHRVGGPAGPLEAREHLSNLNRAERNAGGCSPWRLAHLDLVGRPLGCLFGIEDNHRNPPAALRAEPVASPRSGVAGHRYGTFLNDLSRLVVRPCLRTHFDEYRVHASPHRWLRVRAIRYSRSRCPWSSRLRQPVKGCLPTFGRGVPETMPLRRGWWRCDGARPPLHGLTNAGRLHRRCRAPQLRRSFPPPRAVSLAQTLVRAEDQPAGRYARAGRDQHRSVAADLVD